jgi:hypothetical protein
MHNLSLVPGQQAVFTCMIEHRCMVPIIKWYYNSPDNSTIKVIKTGKSPGDPHVHKIERVSAEDEGTYSCVAENVIGETRISAYLAVSSASHPFPFSSCCLLLLLLLAGIWANTH